MLTHTSVLTLMRGIAATKGAPKVVRDKDGNVVLKADGDKPGQPIIENKPFDITPKARYAMSRTLDSLRGVSQAIEEYRASTVADMLVKKTARLRAVNPAAPAAESLKETEDPEHAEFVKSMSAFMKETAADVRLHMVDIKEFRLSTNLDLSAETVADLMPMLTGELE